MLISNKYLCDCVCNINMYLLDRLCLLLSLMNANVADIQIKFYISQSKKESQEQGDKHHYYFYLSRNIRSVHSDQIYTFY